MQLRRLVAPALVALVVGSLAWTARTATNLTTPYEPGDDEPWFSIDPDSHYHMRRALRLLAEGAPVAEHDPFLAFPKGSAIPWPPYYTYLLAAWIAPGAPPASAAGALPPAPGELDGLTPRARHVEGRVASLPLACAVATSLVVAACAGLLAGPVAALAAGSAFALLRASIWVSALGTGDHHAWVRLLLALVLLSTTRALGPPDGRGDGELARRRLRCGLAAGLAAGLAIGSWVASLVHVVLVQAVLGLLLLRHARRPLPGLPAFGLAFHAAALAALAPAVATSPWRVSEPWMVVNLSWFHPLQLALGALVFAPLVVVPVLRVEGPALRRWPWIVAGALVVLAGACLALDVGPAEGLREAFAWAARTNRFMGFVQESRPLIGGGAGLRRVVEHLGYGALLAPLVWAWALWRAARGALAFLPWVVFLPVLGLQAMRQARFAGDLGVPLAVLLGAGLAAGLARSPLRPAAARAAVALALVLASQASVAWTTAQALARGGASFEAQPGLAARNRAQRRLIGWLRGRGPAPEESAVMASWHLGHPIEWIARRPTVGTNFGLYVGEASYLAPFLFLLSEDDAEAEQLLASHRARHVLVTADWPRTAATAASVAHPDRVARWFAGDGEATPAWFATLGARLLDPWDGSAPDFLRLVHVAAGSVSRLELFPDEHGPSPVGFVWEHVPGARLEARGEPGEVLSVELELVYPPGQRLRWHRTATADATGTARLRLPYASEDLPRTNGDARVVGRPLWTLGDRRGRLLVREEDVLAGRVIALD